ncbi:hypothetical protein ACIBG8_33530 [Nonomuraea sp. NPDC050556]|uniref:hypothetical protein n=1 Tax=Nonomuraea sp. NPDC050556 TaxID=3364369 RepID=UPI003794C3A1
MNLSVREARVAAGLAELERWLADQVRHGLAAAGERDWAEQARRLVDAQAPGVAGMVSRLGRVPADGLLGQYALVNLLAVAYRNRGELPGPLVETVLSRVGFTVVKDRVLAGPAVRDVWVVVGVREEAQDRLVARRVWLRGRGSGRAALLLTFAPNGQPHPPAPRAGDVLDAALAFYPGAAPLRALVVGEVSAVAFVPPGSTVEEALDEVAATIAADPWTESWPLVLSGVIPGNTHVGGLPLHPAAHDPWRLIAVSGGAPVTVAVEWTPQGLIPMATWTDDGLAVTL